MKGRKREKGSRWSVPRHKTEQREKEEHEEKEEEEEGKKKGRTIKKSVPRL